MKTSRRRCVASGNYEGKGHLRKERGRGRPRKNEVPLSSSSNLIDMIVVVLFVESQP